VKSYCTKLVEANKGVGLDGRGVRVSGPVRGPGFPFLHEEVVASLPSWGVGAPIPGVRIEIGNEVLRGEWEGGEPIAAQEKQQGVGDGLHMQGCPLL